MAKRNSVLEIDLAAISKNVEILQSYLKPNVKHLAVVKADAYGHGAVEVSRKIASQVDWFAVNDVQEGIELRAHNIDRPILVFGPPEVETGSAYYQYQLTATIGSAEQFALLAAGTQYHLLFDTGMGRLGFNRDEIGQVQNLQKNFSRLHCTGIYSHFATADESGSPKLNEQYQYFQDICTRFNPELLAHMCNTGGTAQLSSAHFDMVRTGLGIYGFGPGEVNIPGLSPAMHWITRLVQVKRLKKGETVSYGAAWECPQDGYLGILPVGFEDGLPRRLSGNLEVKIGEAYYAVAGIITMNYTMVYLRNQNLKTGTEVFLLDKKNSARSWADVAGTIAYEILTHISKQIPRKYLDEG